MIPHGWETTYFGNIIRIANGQVDPRDPVISRKISVGPDNIFPGGRLNMASLQTAGQLGQISGKYAFDNQSILYSKIRPNLNKVAMPDFDGICSADMYPIWPKDNRITRPFIYYLMISNRFVAEATSRAFRTGMPKINRPDLESIEVLLPPFLEQKKIAEILSTWDRAIETTEALIANSQAQKKALMQQLLTGKKRLPGFAAKWSVASLDQLFHFKKGQGLSKDAIVTGGKNKCILYGELYTTYLEVIKVVASRTNSELGLKSEIGDVLIPASTTTTGIDLANATALLESNVLLSGDINVLRRKDKDTDPVFYAYYLTHIKRHEIASQAQGATIIHLYSSHLKPIEVDLPPAKEQSAISKIIKEADQQIDLFQKKLAGLKLQKSALMQQLLTGKRRVHV